MRPTLLYIATLFVLACAAFSSCEQNDNQAAEQIDTLKYQYSLDCSRELMKYTDIEITYAKGNGEIVIDTLTIDNMSRLSTAVREFDGNTYTLDTTSIMSWIEDIDIDTIPARLYLKSRYLIKPDIDIDNDKMVHIGSRMQIQYIWDWDSTCNFKINGSFRCIDCPIHDVKGSKLKTYLELVNDEPPTLDYILQRKASNRTVGELVENN